MICDLLRHRLGVVLLAVTGLAALPPIRAAEPPRPNILWLTSEDNGLHLGCYGDTYATTPNLDALAARGLIYLHAWSNAPVCAPARTAIISGLYPNSTGAEHMRSLVRPPGFSRMFPTLLREAGYYCTNNQKEDYNLEKPGRVWDESSGRAHWRNRRPGQPFFAVFNHEITHESQIRKRPHDFRHDPARVRVPAYHPDTPEVRQDWAQYYDRLAEMDAQVGAKLRELEQAGLAEDTIVFYYGDHGPGLPRCKRAACDSGLHVPLIVYVPPKLRALAPRDYAPGGRIDRLVSFVDLAPTVLSLAGVRPPAWMQGRAFMGPFEAPPPEFLFGLRGRMDERHDLVRSVRDQRYVYVRNFMPHRPHGQHVAYMFLTPTTQVWKQMYDQGRLTAVQEYFWGPKAPEELYDLRSDPDEVANLAESPDHQEVLGRMRRALREQMLAVRDVGLLPEGLMHERSRGSTPYDYGHDAGGYDLKRVLAAAELASSLEPAVLPELRKAMTGDADAAVRYWGAMGVLIRGQDAALSAADDLRKALGDASPHVRIAAAEALG
ncbi:MAG: sulfatase-like hydrolase/transferase, partial [Phycisphaerae bacterium]